MAPSFCDKHGPMLTSLAEYQEPAYPAFKAGEEGVREDHRLALWMIDSRVAYAEERRSSQAPACLGGEG